MSSKTTVRAFAPALALIAFSLYLRPDANAGTITFNDLTDDLTVSDTTGRITSPSCSTNFAFEECFVALSAPSNTVSFSGTPTSVNALESPGGRISDVLTFFDFIVSGGMIQFVSDVEGGAVLDPVGDVFVVETGTLQNLTSVTWTLSNGSSVVDTIGFISDVEVPEPHGLPLLGIALLGAALLRRKANRFWGAGHSDRAKPSVHPHPFSPRLRERIRMDTAMAKFN